MVRALLDGRKTQTRRQIKNVPSWDHYGRDIMDWGLSGIHQGTYDWTNPIEGTDRWHLDVQTDVDDHSRRVIRCPYGAPGDVLWVKETWQAQEAFDLLSPTAIGTTFEDELGGPDACPVRYLADGKCEGSVDLWQQSPPGKTRVSIHMPRWASRLSLRITDVRVERLNDCSEADGIAEGLQWVVPGKWAVDTSLPIIGDDPRQVYRELWDHINGPGAWAANPWVWAVSFEVIDPDAGGSESAMSALNQARDAARKGMS